MCRLQHLVVSCLFLSGCFGPGEGVEVPRDQIYFPVGLALDSVADDGGASKHLLVVSSDFDLQYNGGAVQSYDLGVLYEQLPVRCASTDECRGGLVCDAGLCVTAEGDSPCATGDRPDADRLLYPGRCNPISPTLPGLQISTAKIGAFATDAVLRASPDGSQRRLFVPVRGDRTLHWLDVTERDGQDGSLDCGQQSDGACDARHRVGDDASETTRGIELGAEPFAIDATAHAENIVVTNQTTGVVALFTNDQNAWSPSSGGPKLEFAYTIDSNSRLAPVGVAALPLAQIEEPSAAAFTFMLTFRNSAQVRLFRSAADDASTPARGYLVDGGGVGIVANSVGSDSRGIAIDDAARKSAERDCAAGDASCLQQAALVPLDVYVANRSPASLLIGRTTPPQQYPYFFQSLPLTAGPSRVVIGKVTNAAGGEETRVFVVCFESRRIFVYDPARARIEAEIFTGRGPHAVSVDTQRKLLYVGHFTDSYIGIFSLDLAHPDTYGTMLGTLGEPQAPRSSK